MKKQDFKITAPASLKETYSDLLSRDFTDESFAEALSLIRRLAETSGFRIVFSWEEEPSPSKRKPYEIPAAANDYLKEYLERANASLPTEMPEELREKTVLERRAQEVAVFLTFQSRVNIRGEAGFFRDVQSLLFQMALHSLSPRLQARQLHEADSYLMHALYAHAQLAWTDAPAHQRYLLGTLYEHLGQQATALELLHASIQNSSPHDHEFLTKAQTLWSILMESHRLDEAKAFVLDLYRRAAPKDLEEIQELVDETFTSDHRTRRAS